MRKPFIYSCIFAGQQTTITNLLGKGETRRGCSALRIHLILEYRPSILTQLTAESQKPPFFFPASPFVVRGTGDREPIISLFMI